MSSPIPVQTLLNACGHTTSHLLKLPEKYHSLNIERKNIIKIIAATSGIFLTIGSLFGFIPFLSSSIGYFTPHIIEKIQPQSSDINSYYTIGLLFCFTFFGLKSALVYITGALLYKLEPITLSDLYLLFNKTEPEVSFLLKDIFSQTEPWLSGSGLPISPATKEKILKQIGNKITEEDISKIWEKAEGIIPRYQYNQSRLRYDHRLHLFLQLLENEKQEEFINNYNWPREIPDRGISARQILDAAYNFLNRSSTNL